MMIERATDAAFINEVANHPAVRPHLHGRGAVDYSRIIADRNHVVLQGEHGAMAFIQQIPCCYEIHSQCLPTGRGGWMLDFAQSAVDWMFSRTNCNEVFTRVPEGNVAAMALTRACGARPEQKVWQDLGDRRVEVTLYSGRVQDWIKQAGHLPARGHMFHVKLQEKVERLGIDVPIHGDDAWHDRHVGAAAGMITGGQPIKGVMVFNRWAAMAMAPVMKVVSLDPLVLDITHCNIEVYGDDFDVIPKEIEPCRVAS